jgi:HK97 family phage major capsid protein
MNENVNLSDQQFGTLLDEMARRFQPVIEEKAHQAMRDAGLTKVDRKHAMFPGADDANLPAKERSYRFFRAVLGGDLLGLKALSEGSTTAGGYLVPDGFREEIIARLPDLSELAPYVRVVPVRADTGNVPSLATDIAITWRGGATAENTAFGESDPVLGQLTWSLKRADAITKMSRELVADSAPSIVEFVTRLFREAIATERDKMIAVGDGTTQPQGIYSASGIESVSVGGALTFAKLVELEQTLPRKYRTRGRWIMNGTNLRRIYSLEDDNGRPLFVRDMVAGVPESRILGYPVGQQDNLPDHTIFFGDLGYYLWFDREEMGVESTTFGGDAFEKHQTWVKVWERADGKVGLSEAFVKGAGITA